MSDRQILLNPVGWLSDGIINAAQCLLKKQFPDIHSLQKVSLGHVMNFCIQRGNFVQILHSNNHWLTVSSIGLEHPKVKVFDSLYSSIPEMVKAQIACLLCTKESNIEVSIMDVQIQVSCGCNLSMQAS